MAITLEQAKALKPGEILHDDMGWRWKVNGQVKTWKTQPGRVSVPIKHGLKAYDHITETSLHLVSLGEPAPRSRVHQPSQRQCRECGAVNSDCIHGTVQH